MCINIIQDFAIAIVSAVIVVPIIFFITNHLELNQYLRLLTKEIQDNLNLIDNMLNWLEAVRKRERPWLPGIATNQPKEGIVLRYLSANIYNNFINQKYWICLNRGSAGRLSELYECIEVYCRIVHKLQACDDNNQYIVRDNEDYVISNIDYIYSEERFFRDNSGLFPEFPPDSYYTNLKKTTSLIKNHSHELLTSNNINSFKDPNWWYPNWLKKILSWLKKSH